MNSRIQRETAILSNRRRAFHLSGQLFRNPSWGKVLILAAFAVSGAQAAIDFTPVVGERETDGIVFKQLIFRDHGHEIAYEPPRGWTCSGGEAGLRLTPPDLAYALAEIDQSVLQKPEPLEAAAKLVLRARVLAAIPSGAEQAGIATEEENPLRIGGRDTYGLTVNYLLRGERYVANTLFVNFDDTQLRFRIVAKENEFPKAFAAFRGSLYTLAWQQTPPPPKAP